MGIDYDGNYWIPIAAGDGGKTYNGTFDGAGHKISNLVLSTEWLYNKYIAEGKSVADAKLMIQNSGFIGSLKGTIKNMTLENVTVYSNANAKMDILAENNGEFPKVDEPQPPMKPDGNNTQMNKNANPQNNLVGQKRDKKAGFFGMGVGGSGNINEETPFESRYFKADFPYGVRILMDIGDIFDLDTPMIDSLWDWYEKVVPVKEEPEFRIIMSKEEFLDIYK